MTRFLSPRGWARFAWQSDYGQFYLIDGEDASFMPPTEITAEMEVSRLFVPPAGMVIYTQDCLQQHIQIAIYESEPDHAPVEPMSGKPWTRVETTKVNFPSQRFGISSPSMPNPLPAGPVFLLDAATVTARISWMEFEGSRDDSVPIEPDVIAITLWTQ
jgi:hypothetical protein